MYLRWYFTIIYHVKCFIFIISLFRESGPEYRSRYRDSLRTGPSVVRIPLGARFSADVQAGPGSLPASCTKSFGSFPGLKLSERGFNYLSPSSTEVKQNRAITLLPPCGPSWPSLEQTVPSYVPIVREGKYVSVSNYLPTFTLNIF